VLKPDQASQGLGSRKRLLVRRLGKLRQSLTKPANPPVSPFQGGDFPRHRGLSSDVFLVGVSKLILLTLIRAHVAAASIFMVGTRLTALIGFQQMPLVVCAAARVALINRRASGRQSHRIGRSAIVLSIDDRCLRTGTDNLQVERDVNTLVIGRGGDEDGIPR
jgi:hypothetical protein